MKNELGGRLWLALSFVFLLSGCSKDNDPNPVSKEGYVKAKVAGNLVDLDGYVVGNLNASTFSLTAYRGFPAGFPSFSFDLEGRSIEVGEFLEADSELAMIFRYLPTSTDMYHSNLGDEMDFKIVITESSGEFLKGTFGGTIRNVDDFSESLTISEGEFLFYK